MRMQYAARLSKANEQERKKNKKKFNIIYLTMQLFVIEPFEKERERKDRVNERNDYMYYILLVREREHAFVNWSAQQPKMALHNRGLHT